LKTGSKTAVNSVFGFIYNVYVIEEPAWNFSLRNQI